MSNYPAWWDTSVTVYNKFTDPQTQIIKWYRTLLDSCFWKYTGQKITVGDTVLESSTTICRIPQNDKFLEKYEWLKKPNDEMGNYFTLGQGDIIVKGIVEDEINEYQSGKRSTDFIAKYKELQGCVQIEQVSVNTGTSLNNPHYYVTGT